MNKKLLSVFIIQFSFFVLFAQTSSEAKAKQLEQLRLLKQQQMEEQKMQNEWHNQDAQQEIKKQSQELQQKNFEIVASKQETQKAQQDVLRAKQALETKMRELTYTQVLIDSAKAELASTRNQLTETELVNKRIKEELQHQEDSVTMLKQEQEFQDLKLKSQQTELDAQKQKNQLYIIAAALALSLLVVLFALLFTRQKALKELAEKNKVIQEEKKRSDDLLLNILPEEIMHELKAHGKTTARNYSKATVLFADIKDFTTISEQLSPDDLIEGLDAYFERFDIVIEKYDIEKIKTIGDAYVCAGGVPTKSEGNPHIVVQAAIEFIYEIDKLRRERTAVGKIPFEFRIGIHTGQLVAGVIGIRKFAYDIWGDTVNMAARMQQASEAGKINVSGATYELVKDKFVCVYRGKIEAKNKGEIDMYFVTKAIA